LKVKPLRTLLGNERGQFHPLLIQVESAPVQLGERRVGREVHGLQPLTFRGVDQGSAQDGVAMSDRAPRPFQPLRVDGPVQLP
jgi:hypothetical protein